MVISDYGLKDEVVEQPRNGIAQRGLIIPDIIKSVMPVMSIMVVIMP
jgi:hypothetical protein